MLPNEEVGGYDASCNESQPILENNKKTAPQRHIHDILGQSLISI